MISRVGAPSTLTLSDKGLSTEIRRTDLTSEARENMGCLERPSEIGEGDKGSIREAKLGTVEVGISQ